MTKEPIILCLVAFFAGVPIGSWLWANVAEFPSNRWFTVIICYGIVAGTALGLLIGALGL